jgi:hypothetical protein
MNPELNKFISTFVQREKQDRYRSLLGNAKRRNDGLWDLLHDGRHLNKENLPAYRIVGWFQSQNNSET